MRLADFILANNEIILAAWEEFARHILPGAKMDSLALRDHAGDILLATVRDMQSVQTAAQRSDKASGYLDGTMENIRLNGASEEHAAGRLASGFDLLQLVSEYRALRASVLGLWRKSLPLADASDVDDVTRLGAGMPISRAAMDLGALCKTVVDEFQSANPAAKFQLDASGDLSGEWDAARLRQVVSNLLGNAIQHGDPKAPITLTLRGERLGVMLAIHNQGAPIPQGELLKIFDPLVRGAGSETPRRNRPGSIGLGLYIARELVLAHGGSIEVKSSAEAGTVFAIHIPRHPSPEVRAVRPRTSLPNV